MTRRPVFQPDLVIRAYDAILEAMADGRLASGERLDREVVASQLGVPWPSVMTALLMLKRDGFAVEAGRQGLMVAPIDPTAMLHAFQVRAALEALAAREAARRVATGVAVVDVKALRDGRLAIGSGSISEMIDADLSFHEQLFELGGNPLIRTALTAQWKHTRRAMGALFQIPGRAGAAWDEHEAIVNAIASGDDQRAARLAQEHAESAGVLLAASLRSIADRQESAARADLPAFAAAPKLSDRARALRTLLER